MKKVPLSKKDIESLEADVDQFRELRSSHIRKALLWTFFTVALFSLCFLLNEDYRGALMIVAGIIGVYSSVRWLMMFMVNYTMSLTKKELQGGMKLQGTAIIQQIDEAKDNIVLSDQIAIGRFQFKEDEFTIGEKLYYEVTPNHHFLLDYKKVLNED